jgi:hypothetical protein
MGGERICPRNMRIAHERYLVRVFRVIVAANLDLQLVEARFFVENVFSFVEDRSRFLGRVADGG